MAWEIYPYTGAGTLKFGMSPEEVVQILGAERKKEHAPPHGARYFFRQDQPIAIFNHNKLLEISFTPDTSDPVLYDQQDLFLEGEQDVLGALWRKSGQADTFEIMGFVIFFPLGVALSGYHDNDPSQKAVLCFAEGRWDRFRQRMKCIDFPA